MLPTWNTTKPALPQVIVIAPIFVLRPARGWRVY